MRYKPLPPAPDSIDTIRAARRAVPRVPAHERDCCARLMDRVGVPSRDEARTWISFLQALGLVEEREHGFCRSADEYPPEALASAFIENVYGAREVIDLLVESRGPVTADTIGDRMMEHEPAWERQKHHGSGEDRWRSRTARLLDWLKLLGQIAETPNGYTRDD